jgi:hypothetical protein
MKTTSLVVSILVISILNISAQGFILGPGESFSFGFSQLDNCQRMMEPLPPDGLVYVSFGNDILGSGESLRLEMFENALSEPPIASQTYSSLMPIQFVGLSRSLAWRDFQGVVRVSMIAGSVEVTRGRFFVLPDPFTVCDTVVAVPEPSSFALIAVAAAVGAVVFWQRRLCPRSTR